MNSVNTVYYGNHFKQGDAATRPSTPAWVSEESAALWVANWRADGARVAEDIDNLGFLEVDSLPGEPGA